MAGLSIPERAIKTASRKSRPALAFIDAKISSRLECATSGPARYVSALLVSALAILIIPLELVPFAVAVPGAAVTAIGVALMARDGVLMLFAYALSAAAFLILFRYAPLPSS